jgi:Arc/MetJ-type ribon-helix-helix transcriptional regulator
MEPVTVSIEESHIDLLDELSAEGGPCTNRSEAMRMIIDQYSEQTELAQEVERLTRERRQLLEQREEHDELVRYVADELSYREQGLLTRVRWWLFGK